MHHRRYTARTEAEASIRDYNWIFYNRQRSHSRLGYVSPAVFVDISSSNRLELEAGVSVIDRASHVNPNTRFILSYVQTDFDTPVTINGITSKSEKAATLRAQFDF